MWKRLVVAVGLCVGARRGIAEPLAWRAEVGCGSRAALATRVAAHLGRPLVDDDGVSAVIEVVKAPLDPEVAARLTIHTSTGRSTREVRGADCAAVMDAVAFVVASAVVDEGQPRGAAIGGASPSVPPDEGGVARRASGGAFHLRADSWSDAGTLPELRIGLGVTLAASRGRWRGEVGGALWHRSWSLDGGESSVQMSEIDARACHTLWRLWGCGALLSGTMTFVGMPPARWNAVSALVRWTQPFGAHLALTASIEGVAAVVRPAWSAQVGRTSPVGLRIGLGAEVIAF